MEQARVDEQDPPSGSAASDGALPFREKVGYIFREMNRVMSRPVERSSQARMAGADSSDAALFLSEEEAWSILRLAMEGLALSENR